ncbi:archease [Micromonospora rubida]|uniref:Archease n=1 Tax=Micromonospora rubida TaxID=2697657 RepID=A0ABW7STS9_9ACTN
MERGPGRGHRAVPHTADVRIEAWAPDREGCVAEAVSALVETFADISGAGECAEVTFDVPAGDDGDLLVGVLDEVIFRLETEGVLPVAANVTADPGGGLRVRWPVVAADGAEPVGAVPKAVSLHGLRFGRDEVGWSCAVTLDV